MYTKLSNNYGSVDHYVDINFRPMSESYSYHDSTCIYEKHLYLEGEGQPMM